VNRDAGVRKRGAFGGGLSRTVRSGLAAGAEGDFAKAFQFFWRAAAAGQAEGEYRLGLL
jgi:TPR repeat protein